MTEEASGLGKQFQKRRKELNLSLKEVESGTSIRTNYLQAIEEENWEKLISPIYAQGFVKQYASFLGLDGNEIIQQYGEAFRQPIQQEFAYGIGTLERRGNPGAGVKWVPNSVWIGAFFVLVLLAYYFGRVLEVF